MSSEHDRHILEGKKWLYRKNLTHSFVDFVDFGDLFLL